MFSVWGTSTVLNLIVKGPQVGCEPYDNNRELGERACTRTTTKCDVGVLTRTHARTHAGELGSHA